MADVVTNLAALPLKEREAVADYVKPASSDNPPP